MDINRVIVLEPNEPERNLLVSLLHSTGIVNIGEARNVAEAFQFCSTLSANLVLCSLVIGFKACQSLLQLISTLHTPPAVAFLGSSPEIGQLESICINLRLCYLGLLPTPIEVARFRRLIGQLRTSSTMGYKT